MSQFLPYFDEIPIRKITPHMIQDWVSHTLSKGLSAATVQRAYRYLQVCLRAEHPEFSESTTRARREVYLDYLDAVKKADHNACAYPYPPCVARCNTQAAGPLMD